MTPMILAFGTSADPFHLGHTELIVDAVHALEARGHDVQEVVILPVYRHHNIQEEFKKNLPYTFEGRLAVCEIAAREIRAQLGESVERVRVSRLEEEIAQQTNRPNFTAETMQVMHDRVGEGRELAFLIGLDSFSGPDPSFQHWFKWEELIRHTTLVVSPRQGFEANESFIEHLRRQGARLIFLNEIQVRDVSSSEVRARLEAGESLEVMVAEGLLSAETAAYLRENNVIDSWRASDAKELQPVITLPVLPSDDLPTRVGKLLYQRKQTVSFAESCTGGLISDLITNVPGSSEYFIGGVVSYAYEAKVALLGVNWETLRAYGAVSSEVVLEMARGVKEKLRTDIGLSVCCIAGPGGATPTKPVGTSWCAISTPEGDWSRSFVFDGDRVGNKRALAEAALRVLLEYLES